MVDRRECFLPLDPPATGEWWQPSLDDDPGPRVRAVVRYGKPPELRRAVRLPDGSGWSEQGALLSFYNDITRRCHGIGSDGAGRTSRTPLWRASRLEVSWNERKVPTMGKQIGRYGPEDDDGDPPAGPGTPEGDGDPDGTGGL